MAPASRFVGKSRILVLALVGATLLSLQLSAAHVDPDIFFKANPPGRQQEVLVAADCSQKYQIKSGDLCYSVAEAFGLSLQQLYALNPRLNCSALVVGQTLCVGLPQTSCGKLYNVKLGDTCSSISKAHGLSSSIFASANPSLNCSNLGKAVGQPVCVSLCFTSAPAPGPGNHHQVVRQIQKNKVLIDYLGALGKPISLWSVPRRGTVDQILALSFLLDADEQGNVQNGVFRPNWLGSITPTAVEAFKAANPGVRVIASIAGYSQYVNATCTKLIKWYNPKQPQEWVKNAVESITNITQTYHLDGIDIDYENFTQSSTFPSVMGQVIKTLKESKTISLVTIAPYRPTIVPYKKLVQQYGNYIDYMNYQFYGSNHTSVDEFVQDYIRLGRVFPRERLLPSTEIGGRGLQGENFFSAIKVLEMQFGSIPGMFLWSAEASADNGFLVEKVFQCIS